MDYCDVCGQDIEVVRIVESGKMFHPRCRGKKVVEFPDIYGTIRGSDGKDVELEDD